MVSSKQIRVHESLIDQFGRIGRPVAQKIKKQFGLSELVLDYPTISQIAAAKLNGKTNFNFRVRKTARDKGVLELF